jgi:hypothetical protein
VLAALLVVPRQETACAKLRRDGGVVHRVDFLFFCLSAKPRIGASPWSIAAFKTVANCCFWGES